MGKKDMVVVDGVVGYQPDEAEASGRLPMPEPEGGWPADEFTGKGGNYVRDPYTGVRSKVEPPPEPAADASDAPA